MTERNAAAMGPGLARVARTYDATPERLFKAWTDPTSLKAWLAGGETVSVDARVDGLYYIEMPWKQRRYPHYGRYLRVESPSLLEFTWVSEGTQGKESVVLIELVARGAQTELVLTHEGLPEDAVETHRGGWTELTDALAARLA